MARKVKPTRRSLAKYFKEAESAYNIYSMLLNDIEKKMAKETGIEDIEFFFCGGDLAGIGNASRTLKLVHL